LDPNLPGRKVFDRALIGPDLTTPFFGVFDGDGHTISHLTINGEADLGLFSYLEHGADVRNLGVLDVNIRGSSFYNFGGLVALNRGAITNCYSTGAIRGPNCLGGLVGANEGLMTQCYSDCMVNGGTRAGGLVGINWYGSVTYCYSTGRVNGGRGVGGLVGKNLEGSVTHCYSTAPVGGHLTVGGLLGSNTGGGSVAYCYSTGQVSGTGPFATIWVGGLVGLNSGYVKHCHSTGGVTGTSHIGGLVGCNNPGSIVKQSYSTGLVDGVSWVGGLVGESWGDVADCYSTGTVRGTSEYAGGLVGENYYEGNVIQCYSTSTVSGDLYVGGLVGGNKGAVRYCYSLGAVSGNIPVGGLVGWNIGGDLTHCYSTGAVNGESRAGGLVGSDFQGAMNGCFWDMQTSGQANSAGGTGKTTAEMQTASTFLDAGWDFAPATVDGSPQIWEMPGADGYPVLVVFKSSTPRPLQGSGTLGDPYLISDGPELCAIVHYSPNAHYRLVAPIDLSGISQDLAVIPWFAGVFDGSGHTISHLTIKGGGYLGLFGQLTAGAEIKDLGLVDFDITGSGRYIGALVGSNAGAVTRCFSTGVVSGTGDYVGGLVGENYKGSVILCYSAGEIGEDYVGKQVGRNHIGGLVGSNYKGDVTQCFSNGKVRGSSYIGGLVGSNSGSVHDCHTSAEVSGTSLHVGGLVGHNGGSIATSYSTGMVSGLLYVGGLVGKGWFRAVDNASFWDIQTSGQGNSASGVGKTTAEMQTASTFLEAGWDFVDETENGTEDIWWILEGQDYPRLWWEAE